MAPSSTSSRFSRPPSATSDHRATTIIRRRTIGSLPIGMGTILRKGRSGQLDHHGGKPVARNQSTAIAVIGSQRVRMRLVDTEVG